MKSNATICVQSEIGPLQKVMVHQPDAGISRVSPRRSSELLFDDIVHLPKMREEHDTFRAVLAALIGKENVLETRNLLFESLEHDPAAREEMIRMIIDYEELPSSYIALLLTLDNHPLTDTLITGYLQQEDLILFDPIPNFIFTRDLAVVVNEHLIITKAAKQARSRENFLTRFICWAHPMFAETRKHNRIINLNQVDAFPPSRRGEMVAMEGGDIMMINEGYLLIGCSERTNEHSIHLLRDRLFAEKVVNHVVQVNIPKDRSYMHIDTIFTQIDTRDICCFKPIVMDGLASTVQVFGANGVNRIYGSIQEFFQQEIHADMRFIPAGGGVSPYQDREQWTDGCNLVAVRPGVALTYDRNPHTEEAFKEAGYQVIHAERMLAAFATGDLDPDDLEKTIITLPSNELSRARGGSHCMTCPMQRASLPS